MYIDLIWLIIGLVVVAFVAYKIGWDKGNKAYDDEIAVMQKRGDVVFNRNNEDEFTVPVTSRGYKLFELPILTFPPGLIFTLNVPLPGAPS